MDPKKDEMLDRWRELHNEKVHNLCSSTKRVRILIFKPKRMRFALNVAGMKRRRYIRCRWECQKRETTKNSKTQED